MAQYSNKRKKSSIRLSQKLYIYTPRIKQTKEKKPKFKLPDYPNTVSQFLQ